MRQSYSIDLIAIMFSVGCLPLMFLASLPSDKQWYLIGSLLVILSLFRLIKMGNVLLAINVLGLGFLWSTQYANQYLNSIEPYIDKTLVLTAQVDTIDTHLDSAERSAYYIKFSVIDIADSDLSSTFPLSVLWSDRLTPKAGQIWQLTVKTRVVHGYLNEGGFDSQRFAMANKNLLTAKLINANLLDDKLSLRQTVADRALPYINLFSYRGILLALVLGDRSQLVEQQRLMMMQTGIAHLMAISGMHILIVFYFSFFIIKLMTFVIPQRGNNIIVISLIAWGGALFYAWLTGLNPPALRAILALTIWIYLRYRCYHLTSWQKVNRIIAILLVFDPFMILSESFWLSCYAVICLIFLSQWLPLPKFSRRKKRYYLFRLLHLQFGLTVLLLPMQLLIFQGISVISLLTNLLAIPCITLVTFPAILIALLASIFDLFHLALWWWYVAQTSLSGLFYGLAQFNLGWLTVPADFYLLSVSGWLLVIVIRTECWRRFNLTVGIILLMLACPLLQPLNYQWRLDMLDVGHGLAIVIHDGRGAILYDTGAQWQTGSAAERVIIPFLQRHRLTVEGIIISHQHNDHIGGLAFITRRYPKAWLMSSSNQLANRYPCLAGNSFSWQNLTFNVLWPTKLVDNAQNQDSCVVQVTDGQFSVLLTGDLERKQEYQLVLNYRHKLASTFLQTPHHGSNTSSSYPFLYHINPKLSFASTSRYNGWKLPSDKVTARYKTLKLDYHVTAKTGQISLFFNNSTWQMKTMRGQINPKWYHDWFGSLPIYE